jgi:uncharacterized OB-fold protein
MVIEPPDETAVTFFARLREHRLSTTRCKSCGTVAFPPRTWCHVCTAEELEWIDLSGRGRLVAFSTQERGFRFPAPDVLGLVDLEEGVRVFSRIDAPLQELEIGQAMTVDFLEISSGEVLHQFRPEQ